MRGLGSSVVLQAVVLLLPSGVAELSLTIDF